MKLADCEISHSVMRGNVVVFIYGVRALSDEERADLLQQYASAYGAVTTPGYVSPDGWQDLKAAAPGPEPEKAPAKTKKAA